MKISEVKPVANLYPGLDLGGGFVPGLATAARLFSQAMQLGNDVSAQPHFPDTDESKSTGERERNDFRIPAEICRLLDSELASLNCKTAEDHVTYERYEFAFTTLVNGITSGAFCLPETMAHGTEADKYRLRALIDALEYEYKKLRTIYVIPRGVLFVTFVSEIETYWPKRGFTTKFSHLQHLLQLERLSDDQRKAFLFKLFGMNGVASGGHARTERWIRQQDVNLFGEILANLDRFGTKRGREILLKKADLSEHVGSVALEGSADEVADDVVLYLQDLMPQRDNISEAPLVKLMQEVYLIKQLASGQRQVLKQIFDRLRVRPREERKILNG